MTIAAIPQGKGAIPRPELHFVPSDDFDVAFHPPSATILRLNKTAAQVLDSFISGRSINEISIEHGCGGEEVAKLLRQVEALLKAEDNGKTVFEPGGSALIKRLILLATHTCNLRCKYCYAQGGAAYGQKKPLMSEDIAIKSVKLAAKGGVLKSIVFLGGEPALNIPTIKAVCRYVETMKSEGCIADQLDIGIVTNGTIATPELIRLANDFDLHITVSLDGPAVINDLHRLFKNGKGTFRVIESNIHRLQQETHGREPSTFEVVYTSRHVEQGLTFLELIRFFKENFNAIPTIRVVSLPKDAPHRYLVPTEDDLVSNFDALAAYLLETWASEQPVPLPVEFGSQEALFNKANLFPYLCEAGISIIAVDAGGNIYPCHTLAQAQFWMGNVINAEVFRSKPFTKMRETFLNNGKQNNPSCKKCWIRSFCLGCYLHVYNQTCSVTDMPDSMCALKKKVAEKLILRLCKLQDDQLRWRQIIENLSSIKAEYQY